MPQISDILKNRSTKAFTKKSYRSYDIEGENTKNVISINEADNRSVNTFLNEQNETINDIRESDNNQETIREQSGISQITIGEQSDNSQVTIREHLDNNQITIGEQSGNSQITIREQSDNNAVLNFNDFDASEDPLDKLIQKKNPTEKYLELSGLQKQLTDLFVDICVKNNSIQTGSISSRAVAEYLKTTYGTLKTTIVRLVRKNIITREQGKSSKTGYINIRLTEELIENSKKYRNLNQIAVTQLDNSSDNNSDNKAIYNSSNTITTSLTDGWEKIDFENLKSIGFSLTQLKQLISHNSPDVVQHSINHFAYGLKCSEKTKSYSSPLNVLMGVLRKGEGWTEPGYKSSQEIAMEQYLENKLKSAQRVTELKEEIFNAEFLEWFATIESEMKSQIFNQFKLPENIKKSMPQQEITELFKEYFKTNIYKNSEINFS